MATIHGTCASRFAPVREAFARNFEAEDVGAACALIRRGETVVDLWGGWADREAGRPWQEDTLQLVFSITKGVTACAMLRLAETGRVDLDAPIARLWPEFAAQGKGEIPVRWVMSHRAGLAAIEGEMTLDEALSWEPVVRHIAAQAPNWEPGTQHGYHMRSYGWILGEVIRRATGKSPGRFVADEIAAPLGLDFFVGLPESEEARVSRLYPAPPPSPEMQKLLDQLMAPGTLLGRVSTGPSGLFRYDDMWNTRALHAAELPSSNGIGTARALARLYAALVGEVDGVRLLAPETVAAARVERSGGPDAILMMMPTHFGTGFMLPPSLSTAARPSCFGHPGAGGSLALADADAGFGFAYVMNQMTGNLLGDRRAASLLEAVYASLG